MAQETTATKTFALEIGTEEIPAFDLNAAVAQLAPLANKVFEDAGIPHGGIETFDSPRRLICVVRDVPERTEEKHELFKGPSAKIAFDEDGKPTKAALGFARGKGADASALEVRDGYVYVERATPSKPVADLLPEVVDKLIHGISWPKSQRWGACSEHFSRPVRWIVALFGSDVVPYSYAGLESGRLTRGHRVMAPGPFEVSDADSLVDVVAKAFVTPSAQLREERIRQGVAQIERETGLRAELPKKTLVEVVNLTEHPTAVMGVFDEEFLQVPQEIIVDAMLMHQRYFPLSDQTGALTNRFVVVSNGDPAFSATIADGNERVVRARLYDAKFFYDEDLKQPLESYVGRLSDVVFQEKLGTVLDKTRRIQGLVDHLAHDAGLDGQDASDARRAALLCKADLVTGAVVEFTSVQGIMGSYYAAAAGETDQVAQAIRQHYMPRFAGDDTPDTVVGKLVAFADKLDTVCGLFAIGQGPTGSSDPFAVRRSAIGIIAMLREGLPVSLDDAIEASLEAFCKQLPAGSFDKDEVRATVQEFFVTRTTVMLKEEGMPADAVNAVVACGVTEPADIAARVKALQALRHDIPESMADLATAFARANNLREPQAGMEVDASLMGPVETALSKAVDQAQEKVATALASNDYPAALQALAALRAPIDAFFEGVMVMDEDEALRSNRLALLNRFVSVFANVADFSELAGN